ncbi:MAG: AgmX/PglI C-terminal domain-containing protein [Labilithrix sp.]
MKPLSGALLFLGLTSAIVIACGDSKPEPKSPDTPMGSSSTADMPPEAPTAVASASAPPAASSAPPVDASPADAGAPAKPAGGVIVGETKDECTPVGVDFEKRARPKLKECYAEGKKKDKDLQGTVKIKITVDLKGKIKSTKVIEKTLPDPVASCMLKAVQGTPFPEVEKCWDSTITIPITFPTPR